ncbi:MAG: hypothetical protein KC474_03505 [Cyanobacteria bacterium HKST-UBA04]|nr:hypothetical protein [Cyanobacteria bacterium HKST-UBA04]
MVTPSASAVPMMLAFIGQSADEFGIQQFDDFALPTDTTPTRFTVVATDYHLDWLRHQATDSPELARRTVMGHRLEQDVEQWQFQNHGYVAYHPLTDGDVFEFVATHSPEDQTWPVEVSTTNPTVMLRPFDVALDGKADAEHPAAVERAMMAGMLTDSLDQVWGDPEATDPDWSQFDPPAWQDTDNTDNTGDSGEDGDPVLC